LILDVSDPARFGPLPASDLLLEAKCLACKEPFKEGEYAALIALGPGADPEERRKARAGLIYIAAATVVHYACATGEELP
jgi:hypothetical protein